MAEPTPAELLALIADRAPALRKAGVTEVTLAGFSVKLSPHVDEADSTPTETEDTEPVLDPLDDAESYGRARGSPVPGFAALRDRRGAKGNRS